ncbi:hypothetical protein B0I32_14919 [Nonomuraea fuscirosea]|uniref:Uncharacterized protein n=1 Tax=Nonomuraea fuscirosea TaxID=1291556 RepID=A0A2T0LNR2_9ACTN|nr:hypothetical protein B0I32_14919 [Nonomuraea fuscirosea]
MHEDPNHRTPSVEELRSRRRPPYGLPLRDRRRPGLDPGSFDWRKYSTPTPPRRATLHDRRRRALPVLAAALLSCAAFSIWASPWGTGDAASRPNTASTTTPVPSVAGHSMVSTPWPSSRAVPSTTPRTRPNSSKSKVKSAKPRRRSVLRMVPRPQHRHEQVTPPVRSARHQTRARAESRNEPSTPADWGRSTGIKGSTRGVRETSASLVAARCDELFPPSHPAFRLRNQACHQIYG